MDTINTQFHDVMSVGDLSRPYQYSVRIHSPLPGVEDTLEFVPLADYTDTEHMHIFPGSPTNTQYTDGFHTPSNNADDSAYATDYCSPSPLQLGWDDSDIDSCYTEQSDSNNHTQQQSSYISDDSDGDTAMSDHVIDSFLAEEDIAPPPYTPCHPTIPFACIPHKSVSDAHNTTWTDAIGARRSLDFSFPDPPLVVTVAPAPVHRGRGRPAGSVHTKRTPAKTRPASCLRPRPTKTVATEPENSKQKKKNDKSANMSWRYNKHNRTRYIPSYPGDNVQQGEVIKTFKYKKDEIRAVVSRYDSTGRVWFPLADIGRFFWADANSCRNISVCVKPERTIFLKVTQRFKRYSQGNKLITGSKGQFNKVVDTEGLIQLLSHRGVREKNPDFAEWLSRTIVKQFQ